MRKLSLQIIVAFLPAGSKIGAFNCGGVRHCFNFQLVKIQINFVYLNNKRTALLCENDPNKHHAIIKIINFINFTVSFWPSTNLFIENSKNHI